MLTRKATSSGSLITASTSQHRNVATKLAPKWSPPQAPAPSTPPRPSIPPSNLGKWALPRNNGPSTLTGATAPGKWTLPDLKAALPSRSPSKDTPQRGSPSQMPQLPPSTSSPSIGKWARPANLQPVERSSPSASPHPAASTYRTRDGPRMERDITPHQGRIPRPFSQDPSHADQRRGTDPRALSPSSIGKWARSANLQGPQSVGRSSPSTSSASPQPATPTSWTRDDERLERDIAPHHGRIPRENFSHGDHRRGTFPRDTLRDRRRDAFQSTSGSPLRHQPNLPKWSQEVHRSKPTNLDSVSGVPKYEIVGSVEEDPNTQSMPPSEPTYIEDQSVRDRAAFRDPHREKYKTRGSLLDGGEIERRSRVSDLRAPRLKTHKPKRKVVVTEDVFIPTVVSVGQLARLLGVRLEPLQRKMVQAGMAEHSSYDHVLNSEYASMLALEFNKNPVVNDEAAFDIFPPSPYPDPSTLPQRPPVVTIMGHVDHGKTTLLDTLRSASVAKGEAGGITQHIGAFSVPVPASSNDTARTITFLDTPGHAAFSAMRARGAGVTDIVVLVVAADDGVMPQTKEVIELIKKEEGKVGVVVAINKIDKPGVDPETIQNSLLAEGLQLETFGGDIPSVEVSGLTGLGLDRLVETISAVAEMADYRAEQKGNVFGYVLESKILKGLGPVATVLVLRGDLAPAKNLISGTTHARVRNLSDSTGKVVKVAYPGMAVTVSGWKEVPNAGDEVIQGSEADIKRALVNRKRRAQLMAVIQDAEAINIQRRQDRERKEDVKATSGSSKPDTTGDEPVEEKSETKKLRLVIKGDVSGSVEAVDGALQGIGNKDAAVKVVQSSVGNVTESDVMMAKTAEGMIVAFSVAVPRAIETLAATNNVPILKSSVIYHLMDEIKQKIIEMLPPVIEKRVTGEATVQQIFEIQLKRQEVIKVAGCRVTNGLMEKNRSVRLMRDGVAVYEGSINTLRHLKKDVLEMRKDMECGISLQKFDDIQAGDVIQAINIVQKPGVL